MTLRRGLRRYGLLGAFLAMYRLALAGPAMQPQEKNLAGDRQAVNKFLDGIAKGTPGVDSASMREYMTGLASIPQPNLTTADFNQAGKNPLVTAHAVANSAIWGAIAAQAVGTAEQAAQAQFITKYGRLMAASSSNPIAKAGAVLLKEADQVVKGNKAGALDAAKEFGGIPLQTFDPSASLSPADQATVNALQDVTAYDWGSMWLALGQAVLAAVAGFIQGGIYGAIIALVLSLVVSLMSGAFTSQTHSLKGKGGGNKANTGQAWAGQAGAALVGGQAGRLMKQDAGVKENRGQDSASGGSDLPTMQSQDSQPSTEIKATGGAATGNVLPGGK